MSTANKTPNYNLPIFEANDKGSWIGDLTPAFSAIDTAMYNNASSAQSAISSANNALNEAQSAINSVSALSSDINKLKQWTLYNFDHNPSVVTTSTLTFNINRGCQLLQIAGHLDLNQNANFSSELILGNLPSGLRPPSGNITLYNAGSGYVTNAGATYYQPYAINIKSTTDVTIVPPSGLITSGGIIKRLDFNYTMHYVEA